MTIPRIDAPLKPWAILASGSVAIVAFVVLTAAALAPGAGRTWLLLCSVVAIGAAAQSAAMDQRDLTTALLFSMLPVAALVADGSPTWLVGPLGALLLAAAELNALSWQCRGATVLTAVIRRRLTNSGVLVGIGLVAALVVTALAGPENSGAAGTADVAANGPSLIGSLAFVVAAFGVGALGVSIFRR